jgi:hypothetical protein
MRTKLISTQVANSTPRQCKPPTTINRSTTKMYFISSYSHLPHQPPIISPPHSPLGKLPLVIFLERHLLLNLRNRQARIQPLRTSPRAIKNSMATIQTHTIIQLRLSRLLLLISAIRDPAETLHEDCRAEIFLAVPPVRGAGCGAAGAENAFVHSV